MPVLWEGCGLYSSDYSISDGDLIPIIDEFRGDLLELIAKNEISLDETWNMD